MRLDVDKCLELSCLFDAKELVTSVGINPEIRFGQEVSAKNTAVIQIPVVTLAATVSKLSDIISLVIVNMKFFRKIVAGSEVQNASFSIEMSLYRNDSLSSEIQAYDDVYVPDFIFVLVQLEIDPTNKRFYLQVIYIDK